MAIALQSCMSNVMHVHSAAWQGSQRSYALGSDTRCQVNLAVKRGTTRNGTAAAESVQACCSAGSKSVLWDRCADHKAVTHDGL